MLPIAETLDRALQACHGIVAFGLPPSARENQLRSFTKDTVESMRMAQEATGSMNESEITDYCNRELKNAKDFFSDLFNTWNQNLFTNDVDRVWQLFLDGYYIRTMQLRAGIVDIRECINTSYLASLMLKPPSYFYRIPLSAELVVVMKPEGLGVNLEIPLRLLFLDTLLMFQHALVSHLALENWAKNSDTPEPIYHRARLDAYVRQIIFAGASTCEAVLSDYGHLVKAIAKQKNSKVNIENFLNWGVTTKLDKFLPVWSEILDFKSERPEVIDDMIKLVWIRNRLVHYAGNVSDWHALQIDFLWLSEQGFSNRIKPYLESSTYGNPSTIIGYEIPFAKFFIDTLIQVVDVIHQTVYREDTLASWMNIPRLPSGNVDFSRIADDEHMLDFKYGEQL